LRYTCSLFVATAATAVAVAVAAVAAVEAVAAAVAVETVLEQQPTLPLVSTCLFPSGRHQDFRLSSSGQRSVPTLCTAVAPTLQPPCSMRPPLVLLLRHTMPRLQAISTYSTCAHRRCGLSPLQWVSRHTTSHVGVDRPVPPTPPLAQSRSLLLDMTLTVPQRRLHNYTAENRGGCHDQCDQTKIPGQVATAETVEWIHCSALTLGYG
jgi:hypothetical protein